MSWDLHIARFEGPPPPYDPESDEDAPEGKPLGSLSEVRAAVSATMPGTLWSEDGFGDYNGPGGLSIELVVGSKDPVSRMLILVRGGGHPLAPILALTAPRGWSVLDPSTGWIDPAAPSAAGWEAWQAYRDSAEWSRGAGGHRDRNPGVVGIPRRSRPWWKFWA